MTSIFSPVEAIHGTDFHTILQLAFDATFIGYVMNAVPSSGLECTRCSAVIFLMARLSLLMSNRQFIENDCRTKVSRSTTIISPESHHNTPSAGITHQ